MTPTDYAQLFTALLNRGEVREAVQSHPGIMIWGTLEARVQGADLVILGGLNDGTWPQLPAPDPWLNRQMRRDAGLLLPERQIGLSAHDYQQAVGAPRVVLTRSVRDGEAETVPSRWLNRLTNLMGGLPEGAPALAAMRARGAQWLDLAARLDRVPEVPRANRPAPRPPVSARPAELAVTGIVRLIRDPYAIYARHILRLFPLDPLHPMPDARLRGSVLHSIFERFVTERRAESLPEARARLLATADQVMAGEIPWPTARRLWRARLDRAADWFLAAEQARDGSPVTLEDKGAVTLPGGFTLTARPDRIDVMQDGRLHIIDYKTGAPPTKKAQAQFEKQLLLEATMAAYDGFKAVKGRDCARITYIGLGASPEGRDDRDHPRTHRSGLARPDHPDRQLCRPPHRLYLAPRSLQGTLPRRLRPPRPVRRMGHDRPRHTGGCRMTSAAADRQAQAADPTASTWLSANAGSGKTTVLTNRVARLLLGGVDPAAHPLSDLYQGRRVGDAEPPVQAPRRMVDERGCGAGRRAVEPRPDGRRSTLKPAPAPAASSPARSRPPAG